MKKTASILTSVIACLALWPTASASAVSPNVNDIKHTITDDAIIFPESYETDAASRMESWYLKNYTATDDRYKSMPDVETSDDVIKARLASMPTRIEMPYNKIVRTYIDRYTRQGRAQVASILGLSIYYMPIFEQALEEEGLPLELKYLPVIESGLDPNAVSRHAATGLWQFMLATAKGVGLEVNTLVDERRDPYASSRHAARYLHDLYDSYGDWSLAIAAYNCGPGNVNKAIRRAGGDPKSHDFWSIYNFLSPETRGYLPMFIAANYVMTYYPEHNISPVLPTKPLVTDTIHVSRRVHFDQISKVLNIPIDELRILNPQFRADVIPAGSGRSYTLILPSQQALAYVMSEDNIIAYDADKYSQRIEVEPTIYDTADTPAAESSDDDSLIASHPDDEGGGIDNGKASSQTESLVEQPASPLTSDLPTRTVTHTVAAGETISDIAEMYKVKVSDIRSWNSLRRNAVRTGQKLRIQTTVGAETLAANNAKTDSKSTAKTQSDSSKAQSKNTTRKEAGSKKETTAGKTAAKPTQHTIKSGENLTTIAKKYGVTVDELRKANNLSNDNIRAGQKLNVPTKKAAKSRSKSKKNSKKKSKKR